MNRVTITGCNNAIYLNAGGFLNLTDFELSGGPNAAIYMYGGSTIYVQNGLINYNVYGVCSTIILV